MSSSGNNTPSTSANDSDNNNNNEIIPMETPPSSPPSSSRKPSGGTDDARTDDANAATLADILSESSNRAVDDSLEAEGRRHARHARTATPSTPVPFDAYDAHAEQSHPHQQQYSTPNRGRLDGTGGTASNNNNNSRHPQSLFYQACQAPHVADLTPIISNNSGGYADANATSVAHSGECEIGIPNMPPAMPPGGRRMMGSASSSSSSSSSKNALSERPRSTFGSFARENDMALVLPKDTQERYRVRDVARDIDGGDVVPSSGARGLRQRRLPPPRAGLPPAKRSSIEGGATADVVDADDDGGVATAVANPSHAGLSSRTTTTTTTDNNNNNHASGGEGREGHDSLANLLGERLAMPSYDDEDRSSSVEGGGNGPAGAVGAARTATMTTTRKDTPSIFEGGERFGRDDDDDDNNNNNMAPVELQPDRKFFSFQGVSQYRRHVVVDGSAPSSGTTPSAPEGGISSAAAESAGATSPSRARRPPAPLDEEDGRSPTLSTLSTTSSARRQYQPMSRNRHGVKEMADVEDLNAIFKAPRNEGTRVVTPFASPAHGDRPSSSQVQSFGFQMAKEAQRPSLFRMAREEEAAISAVENGTTIDDAERRHRHHHHHSLASPYPVESQWSIPSIRLANHVDQTSSSGGIGYGGGHPADSFASYADCSEYTDDDESFYSFLEDDEASLDDSRGSARMTMTRRRRLSGIFQLRRGTSLEEKVAPPPSSGASRSTPSFDAGDDVGGIAGAVPTTTTTASTAGPSIVPPSPGIAPSNSFAERVEDISIIGTAASASDVKVATVHSTNDAVLPSHPPALSRRAHTFDSEAPPPILDDDAATPPTTKADDDAADEYSRPRWHHRGTRNHRDAAGGRGSGGGRNRRARKEGAAVEWLAELQVRSQGVSSESGGGEYLIAEAASSKFLSVGAGRLDGGGGRRSNASSMASGGVAKALGMPHPLCRSSTIEAGSFVNRAEGAFGSRNADVGGGVTLGSTNSIALTSSGSGD